MRQRAGHTVEASINVAISTDSLEVVHTVKVPGQSLQRTLNSIRREIGWQVSACRDCQSTLKKAAL